MSKVKADLIGDELLGLVGTHGLDFLKLGSVREIEATEFLKGFQITIEDYLKDDGRLSKKELGARKDALNPKLLGLVPLALEAHKKHISRDFAKTAIEVFGSTVDPFDDMKDVQSILDDHFKVMRNDKDHLASTHFLRLESGFDVVRGLLKVNQNDKFRYSVFDRMEKLSHICLDSIKTTPHAEDTKVFDVLEHAFDLMKETARFDVLYLYQTRCRLLDHVRDIKSSDCFDHADYQYAFTHTLRRVDEVSRHFMDMAFVLSEKSILEDVSRNVLTDGTSACIATLLRILHENKSLQDSFAIENFIATLSDHLPFLVEQKPNALLHLIDLEKDLNIATRYDVALYNLYGQNVRLIKDLKDSRCLFNGNGKKHFEFLEAVDHYIDSTELCDHDSVARRTKLLFMAFQESSSLYDKVFQEAVPRMLEKTGSFARPSTISHVIKALCEKRSDKSIYDSHTFESSSILHRISQRYADVFDLGDVLAIEAKYNLPKGSEPEEAYDKNRQTMIDIMTHVAATKTVAGRYAKDVVSEWTGADLVDGLGIVAQLNNRMRAAVACRKMVQENKL